MTTRRCSAVLCTDHEAGHSRTRRGRWKHAAGSRCHWAAELGSSLCFVHRAKVEAGLPITLGLPPVGALSKTGRGAGP